MSYLEFITYILIFVVIGGLVGWYSSALVRHFKNTKLYYHLTPKLLKKYRRKDP